MISEYIYEYETEKGGFWWKTKWRSVIKSCLLHFTDLLNIKFQHITVVAKNPGA